MGENHEQRWKKYSVVLIMVCIGMFLLFLLHGLFATNGTELDVVETENERKDWKYTLWDGVNEKTPKVDQSCFKYDVLYESANIKTIKLEKILPAVKGIDTISLCVHGIAVEVFLDDHLLYTDFPEKTERKNGYLTLSEEDWAYFHKNARKVQIYLPEKYENKQLSVIYYRRDASDSMKMAASMYPKFGSKDTDYTNDKLEYIAPIMVFSMGVLLILLMLIAFCFGMQQGIYEWRIFFLIAYYLLLLLRIVINMPYIRYSAAYGEWPGSIIKSISAIPLICFLGCWLYSGWRKILVFIVSGLFTAACLVCSFSDFYYGTTIMDHRNYQIEMGIIILLNLLLLIEYVVSPEEVRKKIPKTFWLQALTAVFIVGLFNIEHMRHQTGYWLRVITDLFHGDVRELVYIITESAAIMVSIQVIQMIFARIREVQYKMNDFKMHIRMEREREKQIRRFYGQYREVKHELKHHVLVLGALLDQEEYEKARNYVRGIEEYTKKLPQVQYSQNVVVNMIAAYYAVQMQQQNIPYTYELDVPERLFISDVDLSMLLTNILDNAIEASAKFSEKEKPFVYVHMMAKGDMIFLEVSNKMAEMPHVDEAGNLVSSKAEKNVHGYGVRLVKRIVNKYDGKMDVSYSEHSFYMRLYLNSMNE